jgi:serine/threonine protein kinase/tetratricopeptide (TPR) repeat protein
MNEREIFIAALHQRDPAERAAFLRRACGEDQAVRGRVEELLQEQEQLGSFLESPAAGPAGTADEQPVREGPGTVIGPYKLLEQIGEGGFGVVFMAEQHEPIRREVALKILKPGMDTRQVIARFEAERQALALMDHPNVSKILDAGQARSGRPYFVMDLVEGVPITAYCDQNQLPVRERLELFMHVCQAVQHAHQKGIIHRDLKPTNVLVTLHDGTPVPKIIDFGIAKALGQQLTDKTLHTGFAQMIGTPLYMSPEQATLSNGDVDTRSDIYSLGVLLYELLTGTTPFAKERFSHVGYEELRRIIREEEPSKPSTRISTLGQAATTVSTNRKSDPKRLNQLFRGELDWIVMKALEKDRNRRYQTVSAFAADVGRYLNDEAVEACPPSAMYRFRKFTRRNKAALGMAGFVFAVFIALAGSAVWLDRKKTSRQAETDRAVTGALAQTVAFLAEVDKETDNPGRWQATVERADLALQRAEELLAGGEATEALAGRVREVRTAVEAAITDSRLLIELERMRMARAGKEARLLTSGSPQIRASYAKALGDFGVDLAAPEVAAARVRSSRLRKVLLGALEDWRSELVPGRREIADAEKRAEQEQLDKILQAAEPEPSAFRVRWRAAVLRRDSAALIRLADEPEVQTLSAADVNRLARDLHPQWFYQDDTRVAKERLLRAAQERYPSDFWVNYQLGSFLDLKKSEEAVGYLRVALAVRPDSPLVHWSLAIRLREMGDLDGAVRHLQTAVHLNPSEGTYHADLGNSLLKKGRQDEAIAEFHEAVRVQPENAWAHSEFGNALRDTGRLDEAIAEYREIVRLDFGDLGPGGLNARWRLADALRKNGRLDEAIAEYRDVVRLQKGEGSGEFLGLLGSALRAKGGVDEEIAEYRAAVRAHPENAWFRVVLGNALRDMRQLDEAIDEYRQAIRLRSDLTEPHIGLGCALADKGLLKEAFAAFRQGALQTKPEHADAEAHYSLAGAFWLRGRHDEAIAECREAIRLKPDEPDWHRSLGGSLQSNGQLDEAIDEFREALRLKPDFSEAHESLGTALAMKGRMEEAVAEYQKSEACDPKVARAKLNRSVAVSHLNRANALRRRGRLDEAIAMYREAIAEFREVIGPNPLLPRAHYFLGNALMAKGELDDAIAEFREALRLKKDYAEAQDNLRQAERWIQLDSKLPKVLSGEVQPSNARERTELASLCQQQFKGFYAAAVRLYREAFAAEPALAEQLEAPGSRYDAACAAALAGCGQGKDVGRLSDKERTRLRKQALDWLRADLQAWHRLLEKGPHPNRPVVVQQLAHWLEDTDFNGVRGEKALAGLPEAERADWQKLWQEVEALRQRAAGPPGKAAAARP